VSQDCVLVQPLQLEQLVQAQMPETLLAKKKSTGAADGNRWCNWCKRSNATFQNGQQVANVDLVANLDFQLFQDTRCRGWNFHGRFV
jgi:hypothetical protein